MGVEGEDEVCTPPCARAMAAEKAHATRDARPSPSPQNELAGLEFIHALVETLDRYFENVVRTAAAAACCMLRVALWARRAFSHLHRRTRCAQCELDIMFNLEKAHFILDEMIMNGCIIETNKNNILAPVHVLDKASLS